MWGWGNNDWWWGTVADKTGWFPSNYVQAVFHGRLTWAGVGGTMAGGGELSQTRQAGFLATMFRLSFMVGQSGQVLGGTMAGGGDLWRGTRQAGFLATMCRRSIMVGNLVT